MPVTFTVMVQLPLAVIVPDERVILEALALAVTVPLHELVTPGVVATVRPAGNESLKATPVRPTVEFELAKLKDKVVEPFNGTDEAPNPFVMVGGTTTVIDVVPLIPAPPSIDVTETLLFLTPAVAPVTFTEKVQLPF